MPSKKAASKTTTVRSRTGCQTCRHRKLKCDEQRPSCGQCTKSRRDCVPSETITFRHHQNSSFGRDGQDHNLDSFFKYSQVYSEEEKRNFLPIPHTLIWVTVSDPTAEDPSDASPPAQPTATSDDYQQVAAHSLEALSTAAADQTTSYPPQGTAYYTAANPQGEAHPEYGFVQSEPAGATNSTHAGSINYFLANSSTQNQTDTSLIDPNLESTLGESAEHTNAMGIQPNVKVSIDNGNQQHDQEESMADSESRLAITLRNFNQLEA